MGEGCAEADEVRQTLRVAVGGMLDSRARMGDGKPPVVSILVSLGLGMLIFSFDAKNR